MTLAAPNGQHHSSILEKEKTEIHGESTHGSTQSIDTYLALESRIQTLKLCSTMEHTAEKRPSNNSLNMTIAKERKPLTDSNANSKDISYLLHPLIQSMNNGVQ